MKLTESQLKNIIIEEIEALQLEGELLEFDLSDLIKKGAKKLGGLFGTTPTGGTSGGMSRGPATSSGGGMSGAPETYQTPTVDAAGGPTTYTDQDFEKARGEDSTRAILKKVGGMKALLKLPYRHPLRRKYRELYRKARAKRKSAAKPGAPARQKGAAERGDMERAARGQGAVIATDKNKDIVAQLKKVNAEEGRAFRAINDPANKSIEGALRMKLKQIQAEKKRLEAAANAANK